MNKTSMTNINNYKHTNSNKNKTDKMIEILETDYKNKMKNDYQKCNLVDIAAGFAAGIW